MRKKVAVKINKHASLLGIKSKVLKNLWNATPRPKRSIKEIDLEISKLLYKIQHGAALAE